MEKTIIMRTLYPLHSGTSKHSPKLPLDSSALINKLARAKVEMKTVSENKKDTFFQKVKRSKVNRKNNFHHMPLER